MKPYQFLVIKRLPSLRRAEPVRNRVQMTFSGEKEDIDTVISLEAARAADSFDQLRITSSIRHSTIGFIKTLVENKRQKIDFSEYLEPVDFRAYLDRARNLIIFQAPKKVCRGVLANLRVNPCGVDLAELGVDFSKVKELHDEYQAVWFRGVSARVRAAGLSGDQIQDDGLFKNLSRVATISSVTLPWSYLGAEHSIMVTSRAGVVLVNNYRNNVGFELNLIMDVHDRLLSRVWHERKAGPLDDEPSTPADSD
jgi:hypothetical protein